MNLQKLKIYFIEAKKFRKTYPQSFNVLDLVKFFPDWERSLNEKGSPLSDEQPWVNFAAIEFLERAITKEMIVFEYGSGGSTIFFAKRAKKVVSIEHDINWSNQVRKILNNLGYDNWVIHLIPPVPNDLSLDKDPSNPNNYISNAEIFKGQSFEDYATSIEKYKHQYFDLIMLDGRARPSCFKHAVNKVKDKGFLVLDNAERPTYHYIHEDLQARGWIKYDFYGPGSYNFYFWQTCVWQKVE